MSDDQNIYKNQANQYERLVSREDYQGNLLRAIRKILPLNGLSVLELGAGTGRVTRLLAPYIRFILALDSSISMLEVAKCTLKDSGVRNVTLAAADHRYLPIVNHMADLIISGWSLCYLVSPGATDPYPDWRHSLEKALGEMNRGIRPDGTIMLIETLGTGFDSPHPAEHLDIYYQWLEANGFSSTWIRTDYQFTSLAEAEELTRFFFGDKLAKKVIDNNWIILPECTGLWWRKEK